jgi:hypothetical protein
VWLSGGTKKASGQSNIDTAQSRGTFPHLANFQHFFTLNASRTRLPKPAAIIQILAIPPILDFASIQVTKAPLGSRACLQGVVCVLSDARTAFDCHEHLVRIKEQRHAVGSGGHLNFRNHQRH